MSRGKEPIAWGFFAEGGMLAALFLPAIVLVAFLAGPVGWFGPMGHEE